MTTPTLSISTFHFPGLQDKISHFEMKLTDVVGKHLGIPEAECEAIVRMTWAAFARICKGLSTIGGDTVEITVTREGVRFSSRVDLGTAQIICRHKTAVDKPEEVAIIELEEPVSLTLSLEGMNSSAEAQSHWQAVWQSTCYRICRWFLS